MDDDVLLDTPTAAKLLGMSRQWLEAKRAEGTGPPFLKLGTSRLSPVRYRRSAILRYMEECERAPA